MQELTLCPSVLSHQQKRGDEGPSSPWTVLRICFSSAHFLFKAGTIQQLCPMDRRSLWGSSQTLRRGLSKALLKSDSWENPYKRLKRQIFRFLLIIYGLQVLRILSIYCRNISLEKLCAVSSRLGQFKIWFKILLLKKVVPSEKEKEKQGYANVFELGPDQERGIRYFSIGRAAQKESLGQLDYLKLN